MKHFNFIIGGKLLEVQAEDLTEAEILPSLSIKHLE
jgi:hypothetical protein